MLQVYIYNLPGADAISNKKSYLYNFISSSITCQGAYLNLKIIIALSLSAVFYHFMDCFIVQHPIHKASAVSSCVQEPPDLLPAHSRPAALDFFHRSSHGQLQFLFLREIFFQTLLNQLPVGDFFFQFKGHLLPAAGVKLHPVMNPAAAVCRVIQIPVLFQKGGNLPDDAAFIALFL